MGNTSAKPNVLDEWTLNSDPGTINYISTATASFPISYIVGREKDVSVKDVIIQLGEQVGSYNNQMSSLTATLSITPVKIDGGVNGKIVVDIIYVFKIGEVEYTSVIGVANTPQLVLPKNTANITYSPTTESNTFITTITPGNGLIFRYTARIARIVQLSEITSLFTQISVSGPKTIKSDPKTDSTQPIPLPQALQSTQCSFIQAFASTDPVYGGNISMMVLRFRKDRSSSYLQYTRFPNFTRVAAPKVCATLVRKSVILRYNLSLLMQYACVRYFLWYLLTGKWCSDILLRRYTPVFFKTLGSSEYACWEGYFTQSKFSGYEEYFLY